MNIPDTLSHFRLAPQAPDRQHVFGWGTTPPLFHNGFKLFMNSHLNFYSFTARRIRDRSIVSQFNKIWRSIPCWFTCFVEVAKVIFFLWFAKLAEQFQVHNFYKTCKSTKNWLSNFGLIKKSWICLVGIILGVQYYRICSIHVGMHFQSKKIAISKRTRHHYKQPYARIWEAAI